MLKNIKEHLVQATKSIFPEKELEFENHDVVIDQTDYFLCRLVVATIPEMAALEERSQPEEDVWNERTFHLRMNDQKRSLYFGLRHRDQLVAFIGCRVNAKMTRMRIMRLSFLPEYEAVSLDHYLIKTLLKRAASCGVRSVFVQVRKDQLKLNELYQEFNFKKITPAKADDKQSEVVEYQYMLK